MRGFVMAAMVILVGVSCGTTEVETSASSDDSGRDETRVEADAQRVGCPNGPYFSLAALGAPPPLIEDSAVPEVAEAIAPFLDSEEGGFWPQQGWRVLEVVEGERVLVVHPGSAEIPSLSFMSADWTSEGWYWSGASVPDECVVVLEPAAEDGAVVDWVLDPESEPLGPDSTVLVLLATERGCASGQPMGDRLHEPKVTLTADAVVITLTVEPRQGDQDCSGNPSQQVEIDLQEPLGQRVIADARSTDLGELQDLLLQLIDREPAESVGD